MGGMAGRSFARIGVLIAIAVAGLTVAVGAFGSPVLPAGWSHISVNVIRKGVPYTLVYDRGVVTAVGADSLTLRESGGTIWGINVAPTAVVTIDGQAGALPGEPMDAGDDARVNGAAATRFVILRARAATGHAGGRGDGGRGRDAKNTTTTSSRKQIPNRSSGSGAHTRDDQEHRRGAATCAFAGLYVTPGLGGECVICRRLSPWLARSAGRRRAVGR